MGTEEVKAKKGVEDEPKAGDQAGEVAGGDHEVRAPRGMKAPYVPSAKEIEAHELTHCPPRRWCDHCVRGQSKDTPHSTTRGELAESSMVRVSMDYCFLTEEAAAKTTDHGEEETAKVSLTVLVMVETLCQSIWAYACESKGSGEQWMVEQIVDDMQTIGLYDERIVLKSDQEASITDLQRAIVEARKGQGTALENSRVGDSNSNGRVERAIQDLKGLIRTLRSALEEKIGHAVKLDDPIVPWLVRHAAHLISVSRVRDDGRTAFQKMKGRQTSAKLVPFGETVLFKIPKTASRLGGFEDRWETGCWIGFMMRSGEHLVGTENGVFKVSTVMRRSADRRWSADVVRGVRGTPECPVPGATGRRIPAFAKRHQAESTERAVFMPAPAEPESEIRPAQIMKTDVDEHGYTEKCPGCRALKSGKYRAKHTAECRKRFEAILLQSEKGKRRFEAAAERRSEAITKKAVELQEQIDKDSKQKVAEDSNAAASGSGLTDEQRAAGAKRQADADGEAPDGKKERPDVDKAISAPEAAGPATAPAVVAIPEQGTKRRGDEADDSARLDRDLTAQQVESRGTKRAQDSPGDSARMDRQAEDMSLVDNASGHPGQRVRGRGVIPKEDLEWVNIGSGVIARSFSEMSRLVTTSKDGPPVQDVHRRIVRSLATGMVIDDCVLDDTPDDVLNRRLPYPMDVRVELIMRGALKMFEVKGADISEIFSQPRVAQEAAVRRYGGLDLKPGWSLDLTREDPMTGEPWDLGKHAVRERVRKLVRDTKPFMVIGSPPCTMFCSLQNLNKNKRNEQEFEKRLENARRHIRFCIELYNVQISGGPFFLPA